MVKWTQVIHNHLPNLSQKGSVSYVTKAWDKEVQIHSFVIHNQLPNLSQKGSLLLYQSQVLNPGI